MATTSWGWATTQTTLAARRASPQMAQGARSVRSQQTLQNRIFCLMSTMAEASAAASSADARRMWNDRRAAVFSPMPGSLARSRTSRAIGPAYAMARSAPEQPRRHGQAARHARHLLQGPLPGAADRLVARRHHQILDHLQAGRVAGRRPLRRRHGGQRRIYGDGQQIARARNGAADQATPAIAVDAPALQLVAHARDLGLQPAGRAQQLFQTLRCAVSRIE